MNQKNHLKFMQRAIEISLQKMTKNIGGPFGAVIVRNNEIISEGWNQVTSKNDPTAHAEIVAIRKACQKLNNFDLSGCTIYTSCEPCPMCLSAIYWAGLKEIYYVNTRFEANEIGFDDQFIYDELEKKIEDRKIKMIQLKDLKKEALDVFYKWHEKEDKILY